MHADSFFDTNLLVYLYSEDELDKRLMVKSLVHSSGATVSTQVLQELANTLTKKFRLDEDCLGAVLNEVRSNFTVTVNNEDTIAEALRLRKSYHYSFYDSLIIAAALDCRCKTLYSEDLQHGQVIDGSLKIVNPFRKEPVG